MCFGDCGELAYIYLAVCDECEPVHMNRVGRGTADPIPIYRSITALSIAYGSHGRGARGPILVRGRAPIVPIDAICLFPPHFVSLSPFLELTIAIANSLSRPPRPQHPWSSSAGFFVSSPRNRGSPNQGASTLKPP